jgi:hypothetical protein
MWGTAQGGERRRVPVAFRNSPVCHLLRLLRHRLLYRVSSQEQKKGSMILENFCVVISTFALLSHLE